MMKRLGFLETKRTPRYSMRKLNVGMASVLLGVTIFGINFTNHSVKAATMQQTSAVGNTTVEQTNTQKTTNATEKQNGASNDVTEKVQQSSGSNNATNSTGAVTTSQSAPKTQGSADTDINSSAAKSAAMNLMATGTGTDRNAAARLAATSLVAMQSNKPAKENQVATEDKIDWAAIKYKISDDDNSRGVEITGWDITQGGYNVLLPNTADFVKRGTITEKQAAYVSGDDLHNIFLTLASKTNNPEGKDFTITISHNKDSKLSDSRLHVKPIYNYQNIGYKGHLTSAFGTYSEHNRGTDTNYQNNLTKADLANLDVSNVRDMSNMFWNAAKLKEVDLTGWQTNSVHDFDSMFFGSGIENLNLSTWNVSNVTDFSYMFANTKNLNVLNISGWKLNKTVEFNGNTVSGLFLFGRGADNSSVRTIIAKDIDLNGHYLQAFKQSHPMEIISNTDKPISIKGNFVIKDPTDPSSIGSPNFVYVTFVDKQTGEIIAQDPYAQVKRPVRDAADQLQAFKDAIQASYDKPLKANDKSLKDKGYEIVGEEAFKVGDGQDSKAQLATDLDKLVDNYYDSSKNPTIMWKVYLSHKNPTIDPNDVPEGMNAVTAPINPSDNNSNNSNTAPTDNASKPTDETGEEANIRPLASKKANNSRSQKQSKSKTKATGIKNSSTDNSKPNNGKSITDPMTGQKENGLTGVAQAATTGAKAGQTNSDKLPQTGEKKGMLLSIIGLLAAALGIFGIAINRKKEN